MSSNLLNPHLTFFSDLPKFRTGHKRNLPKLFCYDFIGFMNLRLCFYFYKSSSGCLTLLMTRVSFSQKYTMTNH